MTEAQKKVFKLNFVFIYYQYGKQTASICIIQTFWEFWGSCSHLANLAINKNNLFDYIFLYFLFRFYLIIFPCHFYTLVFLSYLFVCSILTSLSLHLIVIFHFLTLFYFYFKEMYLSFV